MTIQSYRDLEVWQKARALVSEIYRITASFPKEELYGLASQLRRSTVSVPSNIAEGRARRATKDFMRFLDIAYGSVAEAETQISIAADLGYLPEEASNSLLSRYAEIGRMLNGLSTALERKYNSTPESRILNPEYC